MNSRVNVLLKGCGRLYVTSGNCSLDNLCNYCDARLSELLEAYKEEEKFLISLRDYCPCHTYDGGSFRMICERLKFLHTEISKGVRE